jgi:hypothetical protein
MLEGDWTAWWVHERMAELQLEAERECTARVSKHRRGRHLLGRHADWKQLRSSDGRVAASESGRCWAGPETVRGW